MPVMTPKTSWVVIVLSMLGVVVLICLPLIARADTPLPEGWIDKLTGFVLIQKDPEREGSFEPYLGQLLLVRHTLQTNDLHSTYIAFNRFMAMLERREGGIRPEVAEAIWDFSYQVTPAAFHDEQRHKRRWDKTVDWEKFFWEE